MTPGEVLCGHTMGKTPAYLLWAQAREGLERRCDGQTGVDTYGKYLDCVETHAHVGEESNRYSIGEGAVDVANVEWKKKPYGKRS